MTKYSTNHLRRLKLLIQHYRRAYITQGALLSLSELASTTSDMREFYPAIHKMVSELLHAENFYVVFYDNANHHYSAQYFSDEKDQVKITEFSSETFSSGLTGYVVNSAQPLLCDETLFNNLVARGAIKAQGTPCAHWLGIPLCRDDKVIGVMAIQSYNPQQSYTAADLDLFSNIGSHTITALDRVKSRELLEETVRHRTQELQSANLLLEKEVQERINAEKLQAALYRISELTASSQDMESFYAAMQQVLAGLMPANNCFIALLNKNKSTLNFPFYLDQYSSSADDRPLGQGFTEFVLRSGEAKLINPEYANALVKSGEIRREVATAGKAVQYSTSWLGAPLLVDGEAIGVIALQSYQQQYQYGEHELGILRFVSQNIAVAIQRKLAAEQQKAHQEELEQRVLESTTELRQTNLFLRLQVEERKKAEAKLFYEANHDSLTGLANRQMFLQLLKQQFALTKRQPNLHMALLYIDLDRFKHINDNFGHHIGDAFLVEASKRLKQLIRDHDVAARLGGDEFVVLLSHLKSEYDTQEIAQRIVLSLEQPFELEQQKIYSGASVGLAYMKPEHSTAEELLRDADKAMYEAKSQGRNQVVTFN
ncbi:diguanylate cyclase domain-containing protein [Rheinheimera sp. WS51]|uniref:diguanylate cyclase domain-containing protein n=1 Tax=Rheinheimera sp. WS51 TaxID=3425886 RepID=UPI003D93152C